MLMDEFDGFYFLPSEEENALSLAFFKVKEDAEVGKSIQGNSLGDVYHVVFFRRGEDGIPEFDDEFEAIFADPHVYIKNLIGAGIYGCILRKTEESREWWSEYLEKSKEYCQLLKLMRLKDVIGSLAQINDAKDTSLPQ
jgi:hypothetical protein